MRPSPVRHCLEPKCSALAARGANRCWPHLEERLQLRIANRNRLAAENERRADEHEGELLREFDERRARARHAELRAHGWRHVSELEDRRTVAPAVSQSCRSALTRGEAPRGPIVRPPQPFDLVACVAPFSVTCDRAGYPDGTPYHAFCFEPGCFDETLASKIPIPCLIDHDPNRVLARDRGDGLLLWATSAGLFAAVRLKAEHASLRAALTATAAWRAAGCPSPAPAGVFTGASPKFGTIESQWVRGAGVEYITRGWLEEVSLCLSPEKPGFGAYTFVLPGPHAAHELLKVCA